MRFLSLFSGIEAASVAWLPLGWECAAVAEIDKFPCAVLAHHYPNVPNLGDITKITEDRIKSLGCINVVVFGSPCQDVSVAGKRAGLTNSTGERTRSGLFFNAMEIVKWANAEWVVFENVPGLISSNKGEDFRTVLDSFEEAGYAIDVDVIDAQHCGVPQRRRRIFVCGQKVSSSLQQKTISSGLTVAQCLIESLHLGLVALSGQSSRDQENSAFGTTQCAHSLQRRMKLFGPDSADQALLLRENLNAIRPSSEAEPNDLDLENGNDLSKTSQATKWPRSNDATEPMREFQSTDILSSKFWEDILKVQNESTTSTDAKEIIASTIYSFARVTLSTAKLITPSLNCWPPYWSAASSSLIALKEFTKYARQANNEISSDMERFQQWADFIREASITIELIGNSGVRNFGKILPISEGLQGNSPPSREKRQSVTYDVTPCIGASGRGFDRAGDTRGQDCLVPTGFGGNNTSGPIDVAPGAQPLGTQARALYESTVVTHSLRADGLDASENGTGRGTPLVPVAIAIQERAICENPLAGPDGVGIRTDDQAYTIEARQVPQAVAFCGMAQGGSGWAPPSCPTSEDCALPLDTKRAQAVCYGISNQPTPKFGEDICPSLDAKESGGGRMEAVAFVQNTRDEVRLMGGDGQSVGALAAEPGMKQQCYVAFNLRGREGGSVPEPAPGGQASPRSASGGSSRSYVAVGLDSQLNGEVEGIGPLTIGSRSGGGQPARLPAPVTASYGKQVDSSDTSLGPPNLIQSAMQVRRLTPVECARLQGFPDDYLNITYNGKPAADGPKYKALGNSFAVPVVRWIGQRIQLVDLFS